MIDEIRTMVDQYAAWLKQKTTLRELGDWVEITTPMLDRNNDYLQIYAKRENGHYVLSDDGNTLEDLEQSGCSLESPKRQEMLQTTLKGFGVVQTGNALQVIATEDNFSIRKHNLVQAMLGVNDLFYLASPYISSLFYEDVVEWMNVNDIRFIEQAKFTGKSGYDHLFEIIIPKSRNSPERFVKPINRPDKNSAVEMVFAWVDTKETRPQESKAYALLNDFDRSIRSDVMDAFRNYDVTPVRWSERENIRPELIT